MIVKSSIALNSEKPLYSLNDLILITYMYIYISNDEAELKFNTLGHELRGNVVGKLHNTSGGARKYHGSIALERLRGERSGVNRPNVR